MTDKNRTYTDEVDRERQKKTGEHFTPDDVVLSMLERVDKWDENQTFLDPCCGDGNILETILNHKLSLGHDPTKALKSLYGVELMEDNAHACRMRLLELVGNTPTHYNIVKTNIVCGDAKTCNFGTTPPTPKKNDPIQTSFDDFF